jgi:two-component system, NarL family, response regulator
LEPKRELILILIPQLEILVVDDHSIVRQGLISMIQAESDMAVVAEGRDGREAIKLFKEHQPEVALLDVRMPWVNGLQATAEIRQCFPNARIIILSISDGDEDIYRAVRAGAQSYLCKTVLPCELIASIRAVAQGRHLRYGQGSLHRRV